MNYLCSAEDTVLSTTKDMIEQLKRFDPVRTLQFSLRDKKVLTKAEVTFVPWKDYMERVLRSCYLECLVFIKPPLGNWLGKKRLGRARSTRRMHVGKRVYI